MMVITPVGSALGYYSIMVNSLSAKSSFEQSMAVTDLADAAPNNSDHCLHQDEFKIACHASGSCTFHVCGDGAIATVFLLTQAYSAYRSEHTKKYDSRSLSVSHEIIPTL